MPPSQMLTKARTCTQQLRLPPYESQEELARLLRISFENGWFGFEME